MREDSESHREARARERNEASTSLLQSNIRPSRRRRRIFDSDEEFSDNSDPEILPVQRRSSERDEQRATRLSIESLRHQISRANETTEERAERLALDAQRQGQRHQNETSEERAVRLFQMALRARVRITAERETEREVVFL